jgi:hypothetical protein
MTTFEVSGTANNISGAALGSCAKGATCPFSGMFTVDTTTGTVESSGLDIKLPGLPDFDIFSPGQPVGGNWQIGAANGSGDLLNLVFTNGQPASLVGFTGGSIVDGFDFGNNYTINRGGTVAPVPEPTSLVLLGGVICCLSFSLKRRFGRRSAIHTLHSDRFADRGTI